MLKWLATKIFWNVIGKKIIGLSDVPPEKMGQVKSELLNGIHNIQVSYDPGTKGVTVGFRKEF